MKTFTVTVVVSNCHDCPNRETDRYEHYCNHPDADEFFSRIYEDNKDQLTPTCPMWELAKEYDDCSVIPQEAKPS